MGVWNEQEKHQLISRLSSRDTFISRDGISLTLDPSGQGLYAYWFSVTLGGTLLDGTVIPERQYSKQWDGPWYGASAEHDEGWSAEFFIPWSAMTMPETESNTREMGYSISRSVAYKNERWAYPALPRTKGVFLSRLPKIELQAINPRQQFTFYPYGSTTYNNANDGHEDTYKSGFDVFWRPSSNLQFTATVNPDFGNVESDNVVVNLSSFETFFPEKRAFFLEGQEIFVTTPRARQSRHGRGSPTSLVNTRRIGSAPKSTGIDGFSLDEIEANQPSELIAAAKITGQQGKFRYGLLGAFEDDTKLSGELDGVPLAVLQDGREFGVARLIYEDTGNGPRRSIGWISTLVTHPQKKAIVHGIDAHYLSEDGRWGTDGQVIFSDVDDIAGRGGFVDITYTPERGRKHKLSAEYFDDKLKINDFGFMRRNDKIGFNYSYGRDESNIENLKTRTTGYGLAHDTNTEGRSINSSLFFFQERVFNNNAVLFTKLTYYPKRWEDRDSLDNGDYRLDHRWQAGAFARSDRSRKLSIGLGFFYTEEDLGGFTLDYDLEFAWRPIDRFSLVAQLNYQDRKGWLLHDEGRDFTTFNAENWRPKIEMDIFLSAKQQFRITAQWAGIKAREDERWRVPPGDGSLESVLVNPSDQRRDFTISRLTFQARYRWELAPLSDLFVVYTRGSNVASMPDVGFGDLLHDSWTERLVDVFVVKLRYRLGS